MTGIPGVLTFESFTERTYHWYEPIHCVVAGYFWLAQPVFQKH